MPFGSFNNPIESQFAILAHYAYAKYINPLVYTEKSDKLENLKNNLYKNTIQPIFPEIEQKDLPNNLDTIFELWLSQPITVVDRENYFNTYRLPLYKTGYTNRELYEINPAAFNETLDLLMLSKKIQYIKLFLEGVRSDLRFRDPSGKKGIVVSEEFKKDWREAKEKYNKLLSDVEDNISISWIKAQELEPKFLANPNVNKLNKIGQKLYIEKLKNIPIKKLNTYKTILNAVKNKEIKNITHENMKPFGWVYYGSGTYRKRKYNKKRKTLRNKKRKLT